jgi:high-affinity nickel permease
MELFLTAAAGLSLGLATTALLLGMRHGVDWDHIAAITDLSATQDGPRRGMVLGALYAGGHGVAVLAIGSVAVVAGKNLPEGVDEVFGRIVGWSLIILGAYVAYTLVARRDDFRMQSRWMLIIRGVRSLRDRVRRRSEVEHEHLHVAAEGVHHDGVDAEVPSDGRIHSHRHVHGSSMEEVGSGAAFGVGMLHGVGAETPTQVLIFLAAAQAGGVVAGFTVLVVFIVGIMITNTAIVATSVFGFRSASRRRRMQLALGTVTALVSLFVGYLFAFGHGDVLPAFFA